MSCTVKYLDQPQWRAVASVNQLFEKLLFFNIADTLLEKPVILDLLSGQKYVNKLKDDDMTGCIQGKKDQQNA